MKLLVVQYREMSSKLDLFFHFVLYKIIEVTSVCGIIERS